MSVNNYSADVISQQLSRKFNATTRRKFASLVVVVREGLIIQSSSQHLIRTKVQRPFTSLPPPLPSRPNFDRCPFFHRRPSFAVLSTFSLDQKFPPRLDTPTRSFPRKFKVIATASRGESSFDFARRSVSKSGATCKENGARKLTRSLTRATNLS